MLWAIYRALVSPLLALLRLVPRLVPGFRQPRRFSALLCCLLLPLSVYAGEVTLVWDSIQNPNLGGYKLYYGFDKGNYAGVLDVGTETTYTLTDLEEGRAYYFAIVAYDVYGEESELSQEVAHNGPSEDSEGHDDEQAVPDQDEADEVESENALGPEAAEEIVGEEQDAMSSHQRDAEGDRDGNRSEARDKLHVIPQARLSIVSVDSEPLVGDGAAQLAIDGRVETYWRTEMGAKAPVHPHELVIQLGGEYVVQGFRYLPRQDGKLDGMVGRYSVYVSEDGANWGKAVITGTFPQSVLEQEVTFVGKTGSFVRFVAHSEIQGKPWTSVAELKVLGRR